MVVLGERSRDAPVGELSLRLGEPAAKLGPPELRELDGNGVDGLDGVLGLGDNGVVDVNIDVVEVGVRASKQRARSRNQRARGHNHRAGR